MAIFLGGVGGGIVGLKDLLAIDAIGPVPPAHWIVGPLTLAAMMALNVWTKGLVRISCVLIGLVGGYVGALVTGLLWTTWSFGPGADPAFRTTSANGLQSR